MTSEVLLGVALLLPFLLLAGYAAWRRCTATRPASEPPAFDYHDYLMGLIEKGELVECRLRDGDRIELFARCGDGWVEVKPSEALLNEIVVVRRAGSWRLLDTLPLWDAWSWDGEYLTLKLTTSEPTAPSPTLGCTEYSLCGA